MLTEEEKKCLPITHNFETQTFNVKMELTFNQDSEEVFIIELRHKERTNDVHTCQIDSQKLKTNSQLRLFDRPSNLFLEMTSVLDEITISEYGEIKFYLTLGQKNKFPVTIFATRKKADTGQYLKKEEELLKNLEENSHLRLKLTQYNEQIIKKIGVLNQLIRETPELSKKLNEAMWEYTFQEKFKQKCELVREGLQRAMNKDGEL